MHLTDEEKAVGKENFRDVVGHTITRRDFFKEAGLAGVVAAGGLGAMYFGYERNFTDPVRIGVIGTGDEGNVLIGALNPEYVQVTAIADVRPYNVHRAFHGHWSRGPSGPSKIPARPGLIDVYGWGSEEEAKKHVEVYSDYKDLLAQEDIEGVIIAVPLFLHDVVAIDAMRAGKHVLTEKLMAHSVAQCKEMARVAYSTGKLLATGHQRHYSVLYDNAVDTIRRGLIGDIHHIRAQWHRGNLPGKDSWRPPLPPPQEYVGWSKKQWADEARALRAEGKEAPYREATAMLEELYKAQDGLDKAEAEDKGKWEAYIVECQKQIEDGAVDATKWGYNAYQLDGGYQVTPLEEMIRWRLFSRTGGGLMAELGSHQLDAAGIFISSQFEGKTKVKPLSVTGVGGRHIFPANRDVDDHVYCLYEYPGKGYFDNNDPSSDKIADPNKKVVVSYSSINGNGFGGYGEIVLGTDGTLILEREQDTLLFRGSNTSARVTVDDKAAKLVDSYETGGGFQAVAAAVEKDVSRGYKEEIEHWAFCIRNNEPIETLHCNPKVALADAVVALTSNIAMERQQKIEFDPEWFNPESDATPDGRKPQKADQLA